MKLIGKLLAVVGLVVGMAGSANALNIVNNGSFETGDFTGYAQTGDTSFSGVSCGAPSPDGICFGFFGPESIGGITQSLTTMAGRYYVVSFSLSTDDTPSTFSASFGNSTLVSLLTNTSSPFHTLRYITQATSGITPLSFNFSSGGFVNLDAISVSVPEPASLALLGIALTGMGLVRRRKS